MTSDLRANLGAQRLAGEVRRHRHVWDRLDQYADPESRVLNARPACRCGAVKDEAKSRRGRTARSRGNAYERDVAHRLGARRVGQYGGKADIEADWIAIQAKCGGAFPERLWRWLQATPANADQLRAVVIGDAPGAGFRRREVIVLDLADFIDWFGGNKP